MKTLQSLLLLSVILFFSGCHLYESKFPLTNPDKAAIDSSLLGHWQASNIIDTNSSKVDILDFNGREYLIIVSGRDSCGGTLMFPYRGFVSPMRNRKFMNVQSLDQDIDNIQPFIFYKYEIRKDTLFASPVSDSAVTIEMKNSKELFDFFSKNMNNRGFYDTTSSLILLRSTSR